jgi:hypothetical protein
LEIEFRNSEKVSRSKIEGLTQKIQSVDKTIQDSENTKALLEEVMLLCLYTVAIAASLLQLYTITN